MDDDNDVAAHEEEEEEKQEEEEHDDDNWSIWAIESLCECVLEKLVRLTTRLKRR